MKSQAFGFLVAMIIMLTIAGVSVVTGYVAGLNLHLFVPLCVLVSPDRRPDAEFNGANVDGTLGFGIAWAAAKYMAAVHLLGAVAGVSP